MPKVNLSLILNMPAGNTPANPVSAAVVQGQSPAEMASFQDFLSLMGLSPLATSDGDELPEADMALTDPAMLAAIVPDTTGNILPPALPVLPDAAAGFTDPAPAAPAAPGAPVAAGSAPVVPQMPAALLPQGLVQTMPVAMWLRAEEAPVGSPLAQSLPQEAGGAVPASKVQPQPAPHPQGGVQVELVLPPGTQPLPPAAAPLVQQQVAAQPVLAQLLQGAPRAAPRKGGEEPVVTLTPAVTAAIADAEPAAPALVLPVAAAAMVAAPAADAAPVQSVQGAQLAPAAAEATPERHDFSAVIDKLSEARELSRPGRADMHLAHREFGQVSVQFELAGQALKVAMTSADPGFAPAVQAALADRPAAAVADPARTDSQPQRGDSVNAANASWQAGAQADGQRQDQQRAQQSRPGQQVVHRQADGDGDSGTGHAAGRDGSRFA
ncbi:hypothetical protein [Alteraurantiacibacter buctensis]|uniref:Flagellar hook-length control protein FliK n=1 Tax=Alteraurantiacibacter buctensis TaxID=1503981 RepID=A0A844YXF8_9SPHN|nr:hypothetical protein [Alteraurantiacibacter buctensis]MXO71164.1 hypothetical protein [Alteraurantiacibacter buctensis]